MAFNANVYWYGSGTSGIIKEITDLGETLTLKCAFKKIPKYRHGIQIVGPCHITYNGKRIERPKQKYNSSSIILLCSGKIMLSDIVIDTKPSAWLSYLEATDGTHYICNGLGNATDTDIIIAGSINNKPVTAIAENAFKDCADIVYCVIPASVTSIGAGAFSGCTKLNTIYYMGTKAQWLAGSASSYNITVVCTDGTLSVL